MTDLSFSIERFAIHCTVDEGDLESLKSLIESGISVDSLDQRRYTPLHRAAEIGQLEIAEHLIQCNCGLDLLDVAGRTAIAVAAESGQQAIVRLLLRAGAKVACVDDEGYTLLHWTSLYGWADIARKILEKGQEDETDVAEVDAETQELGATPLLMAATFGSYKVAAVLIQAGADIHHRDRYQRTLVHLAALSGRSKMIQVLLELCPELEIDPIDEDSNTPMHKACSRAYWTTVQTLLRAGASPNIKNNDDVSVLSLGLMEDKLGPEHIILFIRYGAFMEDYDYYGISINPELNVLLSNPSVCYWSIVNKFHNQTLPELYSREDLAGVLPPKENLMLSHRQEREIAKCVEHEIQRKGFCNVPEARPILLSLMCVQSLLKG